MIEFTATECKAAARQAVAILTAASAGMEDLVDDLISAEGDRLSAVTRSIVGLTTGLLQGLDDDEDGTADAWLHHIGRGVEAMPEGGA